MEKEVEKDYHEGHDIIGDEWEDEEDDWANNEINTDALQNKEDWNKEYEKRDDPNHPYCTNWPVKKKKGKNEKV